MIINHHRQYSHPILMDREAWILRSGRVANLESEPILTCTAFIKARPSEKMIECLFL